MSASEPVVLTWEHTVADQAVWIARLGVTGRRGFFLAFSALGLPVVLGMVQRMPVGMLGLRTPPSSAYLEHAERVTPATLLGPVRVQLGPSGLDDQMAAYRGRVPWSGVRETASDADGLWLRTLGPQAVFLPARAVRGVDGLLEAVEGWRRAGVPLPPAGEDRDATWSWGWTPTVDDLVETRRAALRRFPGQDAVSGLAVAFGGVGLGALVSVIPVAGPVSRPLVGLGVSMLGWGLLTSFLAAPRGRALLAPLELRLPGRLPPELLEPVLLHVGPSGVVHQTARLRTELGWAAVTEVWDDGTQVALASGALASLEVPGRLFADDAERARFVADCRDAIEVAR